jgi:D-arabinose 1-dehydrogenase-like Zn-dependent alcohol dehydrogenase
MKTKAWMAKAAKQPMVLETVDPGPLGVEDVEAVVEHCGLCHSSGSPAEIKTMLDFASRHNVAPQTEHFPMSNINETFARLESGKARYRIVFDADF